jgi:hypothetical protein
MQLLAADPILRTTIGEAGRATVRDHYSPRAAVEAVTRRLQDARALIGATRTRTGERLPPG